MTIDLHLILLLVSANLFFVRGFNVTSIVVWVLG